jgi:hypothetical protein
VDFELVLHAFEQLEPFVGASEHRRMVDRYRPVLPTFTELARRYDILNDSSLLGIARRAIINEIHQHVRNKVFMTRYRPGPLQMLIDAFAKEFRLVVVTLNYDDLVDRAKVTWFDGFVGKEWNSRNGPVWKANSFDARAFDGWRDATDPILVHLHGSIRFGHEPEGFGVAKYSDAQFAGNSIEGTIKSESYAGGEIISAAPIISGLNKVAKLSYNPEPFGYYYRAFVDALLNNPRLLIIGYGGRDEHVNTWLEQFAARHQNGARVVWINKMDEKSAFDPPPENDMLRILSANQFQADWHYQHAGQSERICDCGPLRLIPSGFPIPVDIQLAMLDYLRN